MDTRRFITLKYGLEVKITNNCLKGDLSIKVFVKICQKRNLKLLAIEKLTNS